MRSAPIRLVVAVPNRNGIAVPDRGAFAIRAANGDMPVVPSNYGVNATVRPVTPLAVASGAPVRPARYALRWADET